MRHCVYKQLTQLFTKKCCCGASSWRHSACLHVHFSELALPPHPQPSATGGFAPDPHWPPAAGAPPPDPQISPPIANFWIHACL